MNIRQALETVSIEHIMQCLGQQPDTKKSKGHHLWFCAPNREETDASLHIDAIKNIWYDFGEGKGGNVIHFGQYYLESLGLPHTVSDALTWLGNYASSQIEFDLGGLSSEKPKNNLKLIKTKQLQHPALIQYLQERRIETEFAQSHLKQAHVFNKINKKKYFGLAFPNIHGGYEFRNKYIKSTIGKKGLSLIEGNQKSHTLHLFEGFMDFLTLLTLKKVAKTKDHILILNSLSFLPQALRLIEGSSYQEVLLWLDNDRAGDKARNQIQTWQENHPTVLIKDLSLIYSPYADVNEWHVDTIKSEWVM